MKRPLPGQPLPQPFLLCLLCGADELCARGLCRRCYNSTYHNDNYFDGSKERILNRDAYRCRVCSTKTNVVHHRKPGIDDEAWLITLCPACHATVERLQRPDRYLPPLLYTLWREQHPDLAEQLSFELPLPALVGEPAL